MADLEPGLRFSVSCPRRWNERVYAAAALTMQLGVRGLCTDHSHSMVKFNLKETKTFLFQIAPRHPCPRRQAGRATTSPFPRNSAVQGVLRQLSPKRTPRGLLLPQRQRGTSRARVHAPRDPPGKAGCRHLVGFLAASVAPVLRAGGFPGPGRTCSAHLHPTPGGQGSRQPLVLPEVHPGSLRASDPPGPGCWSRAWG